MTNVHGHFRKDRPGAIPGERGRIPASRIGPAARGLKVRRPIMIYQTTLPVQLPQSSKKPVVAIR